MLITIVTKNGANLWAGTRRNESPILVSADSSKRTRINFSINTKLYVKQQFDLKQRLWEPVDLSTPSFHYQR